MPVSVTVREAGPDTCSLSILGEEVAHGAPNDTLVEIPRRRYTK